MLAEYLSGLGFVRQNLITARDVLNAEGKKKYEAYIKNAVEMLPARFYGLKPYFGYPLQEKRREGRERDF